MTLKSQLTAIDRFLSRVKTDEDRTALTAIKSTVQRAQDCFEVSEDMRREIEKRKTELK